VDVGQDTAGSDGHTAQQLGELVVVADGQLHVAGHDTGLLVVTGGVSSQLQNLSGQVLQDRGEVDGGSGTDTGGVASLAQETGDTSNGELESSLGGLGRGLLARLGTASGL